MAAPRKKPDDANPAAPKRCDDPPVKGDVFTCDCGFSVVVVHDCACDGEAPCLKCCGSEMVRCQD